MPKLLRPRHEVPTPLFLVFCALLAAALVTWAAWRFAA
jgi:hypothetical protein